MFNMEQSTTRVSRASLMRLFAILLSISSSSCSASGTSGALPGSTTPTDLTTTAAPTPSTSVTTTSTVREVHKVAWTEFDRCGFLAALDRSPFDERTAFNFVTALDRFDRLFALAVSEPVDPQACALRRRFDMPENCVAVVRPDGRDLTWCAFDNSVRVVVTSEALDLLVLAIAASSPDSSAATKLLDATVGTQQFATNCVDGLLLSGGRTIDGRLLSFELRYCAAASAPGR